jgi:hypothetical protein
MNDESEGAPIGHEKNISPAKGNTPHNQCNEQQPNSPSCGEEKLFKPNASVSKKETSNAADSNKNTNNGFKKWMKRSKEWREKWGRPIFRFAEFLALCAAILTGWVLFEQWREMEQTRVLDERAWIGVIEPSFTAPYSPEDHVGMGVKIANTGKTPALIENIKILIGTARVPFTNVNWFFETNGDLEVVIAPNGHNVSVMHEPNTIGERGFLLMGEKERQDYFVWKITYKDAFNNIRHTEAGFVVTGTRITNAVIPLYGVWRMD